MTGSIKILSPSELTQLCLPLRMQVLHEELGWISHEVTNSEALRDQYDERAIHFGYFSSDLMIGALRLIIADSFEVLPSGKLVTNPWHMDGIVGELSRGVVHPDYRGSQVFPKLLKTAIEHAKQEGVSHLFLSTFDTPKTHRFYSRYGFTLLEGALKFRDEHMNFEGSNTSFSVLYSRIG